MAIVGVAGTVRTPSADVTVRRFDTLPARLERQELLEERVLLQTNAFLSASMNVVVNANIHCYFANMHS